MLQTQTYWPTESFAVAHNTCKTKSAHLLKKKIANNENHIKQ